MSDLKKFRAEMRHAVADYMASEGCGCCEDYDGHKEHKARLAKMLNIPKYGDGSGYDFGRYEND